MRIPTVIDPPRSEWMVESRDERPVGEARHRERDAALARVGADAARQHDLHVIRRPAVAELRRGPEEDFLEDGLAPPVERQIPCVHVLSWLSSASRSEMAVVIRSIINRDIST